MVEKINLRKVVFWVTLFTFLGSGMALPTYAQDVILPVPGTRVASSSSFNPTILKGIKVHPENPFRFDFVLSLGDKTSAEVPNESIGTKEDYLKQQSTKLIKYFFASLTIPEKDLWVNLSPYEKDRIVPEAFGQTEMGRDLLAQDYLLKQITASLIYPEGEIGKKFWKRVYEEAAKKFGTINIPVNTFNKVWIVPEKAVVYENDKAGTAYVVESSLKVMLEEDYLAKSVSSRGGEVAVAISDRTTNENGIASPSARPSYRALPVGRNDTSSIGSQIVREIVIPQLTKEINQGQNFAQLRQVYNSLILATWYKKKFKDSILSQVYANKNKIKGTEYQDSIIKRSQPRDMFRSEQQGTCPQAGCQANKALNVKATQRNQADDVELIYQRYLQSFKKGAYNFIKEEQDPITKQPIPRKYFSGGAMFKDLAMSTRSDIQAVPGDPATVVSAQLVGIVTPSGESAQFEPKSILSDEEIVRIERMMGLTRKALGYEEFLRVLTDRQAHGELSQKEQWKLDEDEFSVPVKNSHIPVILDFARYLLDRENFKDKKLVFIGRGADLIYDACQVLTHFSSQYASRRNDVHLMDWSKDTFKSFPKQKKQDHIARFVRALNPMEGIVFVDELAASRETITYLKGSVPTGISVDHIVMGGSDYLLRRDSSWEQSYADRMPNNTQWEDVEDVATWLAIGYDSGRKYEVRETEKGLETTYRFGKNYGVKRLFSKLLILDWIKQHDPSLIPAVTQSPAMRSSWDDWARYSRAIEDWKLDDTQKVEINSWGGHKVIAQLHSQRQRQTYTIAVYDEEQRPIGGIYFKISEPANGLLAWIQTGPKGRDPAIEVSKYRKEEIGSLLLSFAELFASSFNAKRFRASGVAKENRPFYEKLGYQPGESLGTLVAMNKIIIPRKALEKAIHSFDINDENNRRRGIQEIQKWIFGIAQKYSIDPQSIEDERRRRLKDQGDFLEGWIIKENRNGEEELLRNNTGSKIFSENPDRVRLVRGGQDYMSALAKKLKQEFAHLNNVLRKPSDPEYKQKLAHELAALEEVVLAIEALSSPAMKANEADLPSKASAAMPVVNRNTGGIDFNPENMDLETKADAQQMGTRNEYMSPFVDPAMLERFNEADGLVPQILGVQILNNVREFLISY